MLKHHSKYCFVLDLKYICVLISLEREFVVIYIGCIDSIIVGPNICQVYVDSASVVYTIQIMNHFQE